MAKALKKCPMCGEKIKERNGRLMCISCGFTPEADDEDIFYTSTPSSGINMNTYHNTAGTNQTGPSMNSTINNTINNAMGTMFDYNQNNKPQMSGMQAGRTKKTAKSGVYIAIAMIPIIAVMILFLFLISKISNNENKIDYDYYDDNYNNDIPEYNWNTGGSVYEDKYPSTDLMKKFVEEVFGKSCYSVTEDEYASITYLRVYYSEDKIDYAIDNGETHTFIYEDMYFDSSDLNCFTGLTALDVEKTKLNNGDLDGLYNLEEIWSGNSIASLEAMLSDDVKNQITVLGISNAFSMSSLDGIENFPGLSALYLDTEYITDISGLNNVPDLQYLVIENGNRIADFSPISGLTKLSVLSITSKQLKSINIIKNMNELTSLTISESAINDISAISEHKDNLSYVELTDNYSLKDYSVISELTNVTTLVLGTGSDVALPSLDKLQKLTYLSLDRVYELDFLKDATALETLILSNCSILQLEPLSALKALTSLYIDDASSLVLDITPLMSLTNLKIISMNDLIIEDNIEELLTLPNLTVFYLDNIEAEFDFKNLKENTNLSLLGLNNMKFMKYEDLDGNGYVSFDEEIEINPADDFAELKKFPNLTELHIAGNEISNIDFVADLKNLYLLDISNNYIESVTPLLNLEYLSFLYCGQNTIIEGMNQLSSRVTVFTSY